MKCSVVITYYSLLFPFAAPEVVRNEDYHFAADWWGFGTVIYEMLAGTVSDIVARYTDRCIHLSAMYFV